MGATLKVQPQRHPLTTPDFVYSQRRHAEHYQRYDDRQGYFMPSSHFSFLYIIIVIFNDRYDKAGRCFLANCRASSLVLTSPAAWASRTASSILPTSGPGLIPRMSTRSCP